MYDVLHSGTTDPICSETSEMFAFHIMYINMPIQDRESCAVQFQLSLQLSTDWNFMFVVCKYIVRNWFKTIFVPQNVAVNHSRDILEQQVLIYIVLYMNYFYIVGSVHNLFRPESYIMYDVDFSS